MNYQQCEKQWAKKRSNLGTKKLTHHTYLRKEGELFYIRLHDTDIMVFYPNGDIMLYDGGYKTMTTKARMNEYLSNGWRIIQERGVWYISQGYSKERFGYRNGCYINGDAIFDVDEDEKARKETIAISKTVRMYTKAIIDELNKGNISKPSGGDCWHCFFKNQEGQTMGEMGDADHILSHMSKDERYYVPSLLVRATEVFPVSMIAKEVLWCAMGCVEGRSMGDYGYLKEFAQEQLEKSLRRYIYRQLGVAT